MVIPLQRVVPASKAVSAMPGCSLLTLTLTASTPVFVHCISALQLTTPQLTRNLPAGKTSVIVNMTRILYLFNHYDNWPLKPGRSTPRYDSRRPRAYGTRPARLIILIQQNIRAENPGANLVDFHTGWRCCSVCAGRMPQEGDCKGTVRIVQRSYFGSISQDSEPGFRQIRTILRPGSGNVFERHTHLHIFQRSTPLIITQREIEVVYFS